MSSEGDAGLQRNVCNINDVVSKAVRNIFKEFGGGCTRLIFQEN